MKQACKSIKSGSVFYIEHQNDIDVTLRNPKTGEVKTIKPSTLKRSYEIISEEELKMEQANVAVEEKYLALMECEEKVDFLEAVQEGVEAINSDEVFAEILSSDDVDFVKKAVANANLCFRENMQRFKDRKDALAAAQERQSAHPEDLDIAKEVNDLKNSLNTAVEKMTLYAAKLNAANIRLQDIQPKKEAPTE